MLFNDPYMLFPQDSQAYNIIGLISVSKRFSQTCIFFCLKALTYFWTANHAFSPCLVSLFIPFAIDPFVVNTKPRYLYSLTCSISLFVNWYFILSMFPYLEKVIMCSFHSAQYSQRVSILFCNPLADVESNKRSSANIIVCIALLYFYMYEVVGLFI